MDIWLYRFGDKIWLIDLLGHIALWSSIIFKLIFQASHSISGNFLLEKHVTKFELTY